MNDEITNESMNDSLLGSVAANTVEELDTDVTASTELDDGQVVETTVNSEVSKTYSMEDLKNNLPDDLKDEKTWGKFKTVEDMAIAYLDVQKVASKRGDIPNDEATQEAWDEFYNKLGKPEKSDGYELHVPEELVLVENVDNKVNKLKEFAYDANLTTKQANDLFSKIFDMEAQELQEAQALHKQKMDEGAQRLREEWGNGVEKMSAEVRNLQERLGVFEAFEDKGLNNDPDLLIVFGKLAKDLGETSTIDTAISSTPVGLQTEIDDLNRQASEYMKRKEKVPLSLQMRLQDAFRKLG